MQGQRQGNPPLFQQDNGNSKKLHGRFKGHLTSHGHNGAGLSPAHKQPAARRPQRPLNVTSSRHNPPRPALESRQTPNQDPQSRRSQPPAPLFKLTADLGVRDRLPAESDAQPV
jgi:hypothetical protein